MQWDESLDNRIQAGEVQKKDRSYIAGFMKNETINKTVKPSTLYTIVDRIITIVKELRESGMQDLKKATTEDFKEAAGRIREKYPKANTQRMHLNALKRFCKYLVEEEGIKGIDCQKIQSIKIPAVNWKSKTSEDILTPEELERTIESAGTARNKAIIAMLADGCFRPIEIRTMRWDQLSFDDYGVRVKVAEKTRYEREFRLTFSLPYLLRWRENYPDGKPEGRKPVFIKERREADGKYKGITEDVIKNLVYDIRDRTGIIKLKPSIFRPTGLTAEAEAGTDHTYLCMKGWGNLSTQMVRTYVKPSREYMDRVALSKMGIKVPEDTKLYRTEKIQDMLKPKHCANPKCKSLIPATSDFCPKCGIPISEKAMSEMDKFKQFVESKMDQMYKEYQATQE